MIESDHTDTDKPNSVFTFVFSQNLVMSDGRGGVLFTT